MLHAPSGTDENPNGSNYGWGYNGESGPAWIKEEVDLSKFAGKQVQLRFEYVTDAAVNGQGFLIDDVTLDAVGYSTDFEKDDGGWVGDGFVRVANRLPQTFRATLILMGNQTSIIPLELDANQQGSLNFEIGKGVNEAILVVGGTTRFTNQKAQYEYEVK
jgi:immune inhibitor A